MKDLSIIIPSSRPKYLAHLLNYLASQSTDGINFEIIIIQEADNFEQFNILKYDHRTIILRQSPNHDNGAIARDRGLLESRGEYVAFWDDDNVYYRHAIASLVGAACGHDIGIVRTRHQGMIIPSGKSIEPGDIDTMCFCVKKELAIRVKWNDNGGRYNDFRWISKVAKLTTNINHVPMIIGEHV